MLFVAWQGVENIQIVVVVPAIPSVSARVDGRRGSAGDIAALLGRLGRSTCCLEYLPNGTTVVVVGGGDGFCDLQIRLSSFAYTGVGK